METTAYVLKDHNTSQSLQQYQPIHQVPNKGWLTSKEMKSDTGMNQGHALVTNLLIYHEIHTLVYFLHTAHPVELGGGDSVPQTLSGV